VADDGQARIEVAFEGGQVMGALVTLASVEELDRALATGDRAAVTLEATDGRYTVAVHKVAYVKRFARESRVGFGSS
jgi:molybdopterin-binding protein